MTRMVLIISMLVAASVPGVAFAVNFADLDLGRYNALIISNQNYKHLSPLKTPHADAEALAELLRTDYGFRVITLRDANRAGTLDALDQLVEKLTPNDNLLIFYAGHGHLDKATGEGYWLPVTANPRRRSEWISNSDITDTLRATAAKHVLVISDSCFSGTLSRSAPAGLNVGQSKREYYAKLASRVSRTALSSGGLEPVDDGGGSGHSVFAGALISALKRNEQPILEAESLYTQIKRPVALNSSAIQKPQYSDVRATGHDEGDFLFFKRNARLAPVQQVDTSLSAPSLDANTAYELTFWNSIKDSKDPGDYKAYLSAFPQGKFVALAKLWMDKLTETSGASRASIADLALLENTDKRDKSEIRSGQQQSREADTVLLVWATPDSEYTPKFNTVDDFSAAIAELARNVLTTGTVYYLPEQSIAQRIINDDEEHQASQKLCTEYQAKHILSIELDMSRDIDEITRTPDDIYIGLYNCESHKFQLRESKLDFKLDEKFAYAAGIREKLQIYNQLLE